ncbi:ankyrin repeat domain-containing protein [Pacificispira sp.]|uniref:ankyrin repeat domain-containing protein n=1 Tax=Pacificispira sp. TaxID=2888761 RepID=UPI003B52CD49
MTDRNDHPKPPYPTIGEVCRVLAAAFDTKPADRAASKKLDRLAREGDIDWRFPSQFVEKAIIVPMQRVDPDYAEFVDGFIRHLVTEHVRLVSTVSLDALSRAEALPLLVQSIGAGHAASFIASLKDQFGGPDLSDFMQRGANPVDVVFRWAERFLESSVACLAYPDNKQQRDELGRWRRGASLPSFFGSVLPLLRELKANRPDQRAEIDLFGIWLMTARAIVWIDRKAKTFGSERFIQLICQELLLNTPERDVGVILSEANAQAGKRLIEVCVCGGSLLNFQLQRLSRKQDGSKVAARDEIIRFRTLLDRDDADGRARYMLDWCEGRWHALAGHEELALSHYETAAKRALYRAGENQRQIVQEALTLAAHLGKKPAVKRMKHRAIAMGLFSELSVKLPESNGVVADWEMEQLAQAYWQVFPAQGRFPGAEIPQIDAVPFPFRSFDQSAVDELAPDLKHPDRVINIPTLDGGKYRRPQLVWFASENKPDHVRSLLNAGADVNKLDPQGGSALLKALQCAEDGRGRESLDVLLRQPHDRETLNRLTDKKRLSPLLIAILLGDPEVVQKLLDMGADPELQAGYPPQSPLYVCAERFAVYTPGRYQNHLIRKMANANSEDWEVLRRYGGGLAGPFGDLIQVDRLPSRQRALLYELAKNFEDAATQIPRSNYVSIAEALLRKGSDPNEKHSTPGPGRTPLMVVAENDSEDVFTLMVEHGGDPTLKDDEGNDCRVIAAEFGSQSILEVLRR